MVYGRGVAIVKDELKYTYFFGNLVVDGSNIDFIDAPDSLQFDDLAVVNKVLESKPFTVTNQSTVTFCESSGFIDNTAAGQVLGSSGFIGSKIQLVDAITGNTIGTTRNIPAQSVNGSYGTLVPYSLSTNGIASKQVKVKITLSTNLEEAKSALIRSTSTVDLRQGLGKASTEQVAVLEMDLPSRFSLDQNYPNPFNPTTTIRYGLSTNAMVTLSVFNTLGQLVTTLVNEEERPGYHEVKFDGSNLASGVYFYRLSAGSFVQTRKLLLVR